LRLLFVEILGQSQPKISRHLAYLRQAGIVTARREGKWMHYSICTPADAAAPPSSPPHWPLSATTGRCAQTGPDSTAPAARRKRRSFP